MNTELAGVIFMYLAMVALGLHHWVNTYQLPKYLKEKKPGSTLWRLWKGLSISLAASILLKK